MPGHSPLSQALHSPALEGGAWLLLGENILGNLAHGTLLVSETLPTGGKHLLLSRMERDGTIHEEELLRGTETRIDDVMLELRDHLQPDDRILLLLAGGFDAAIANLRAHPPTPSEWLLVTNLRLHHVTSGVQIRLAELENPEGWWIVAMERGESRVIFRKLDDDQEAFEFFAVLTLTLGANFSVHNNEEDDEAETKLGTTLKA